MKIKSAIAVILIISNLLNAQIKVRVTGVSDNIYNGEQQDRKEAVLDAKVQADEKIGVKIEAKTTIKNFILQEDLIESLAKAYLLPDFEIVDLGYSIDLSGDTVFKVILIGEVSNTAINRTGKLNILSKDYYKHVFNPYQDNEERNEIIQSMGTDGTYDFRFDEIRVDDVIFWHGEYSDYITVEEIPYGPHNIAIDCISGTYIEQLAIDKEVNSVEINQRTFFMNCPNRVKMESSAQSSWSNLPPLGFIFPNKANMLLYDRLGNRYKYELEIVSGEKEFRVVLKLDKIVIFADDYEYESFPGAEITSKPPAVELRWNETAIAPVFSDYRIKIVIRPSIYSNQEDEKLKKHNFAKAYAKIIEK